MAEFVAKNVKHMIVNLLGLNALRPVDDGGVPKQYEGMTEDEKESFLPLVAWIGHPELLKKVAEQFQVEHAIIESESNQAYEQMVDAIDAAGGDMVPILGELDPTILAKIASKRKSPNAKPLTESNIDLVGDV